ncbi:MAG: hypothetical protein UW46_C0001G0077 [Candidatus Yanofskybacteria bacterium GW2011_GWF1_44_227]|uniref:GtrA/DPMS transmembrane domain-containing protein n=1 Tax=Candidatus Yanofskybacteria bacterium GW2011_GWE2_40_11 TaxID=1619033 RepID=A0A0G0QLX5_9BACT|nr:MAG: hypothetical protein UT69_C0013G0007 [Candidatus Yanofskybacteria bacterium GW2011_GWE1_40_10]KKR41103.1 MAG: hypothetical protein UT75_C0001G0007 [Candidatus Yanofskybacteria bacterium GW2011_GWE2_40_11]KKT15899.1 MAG: hypothetical protein UV97_C0001G0072 [Candidatus Yanofskybacteria bacterium GW2011_GWF2_43_596]KKT53587.1 MAG: hypothetical protein UW46_C0001G0077 [Candidatus Yanofskybacteria bacterium GW2011_GWF1_44_227]OGN36285.1 MAG: hypothetical protein A2241_00905 [Candidatus Yano
MKFTKKDFVFSVITGLIAGFIGWRVLEFLGTPIFLGMNVSWLVLIIPILWIFGVNLGYFLGRWVAFFNQFGKYVAVGFTNFAVDIGVLNLLFALSGHSTGNWFTSFKTVSVIVALLTSYMWNKYWAFNASQSGEGGKEFAKFIAVTALALIVNTATASFVARFIGPQFGLDAKAWGTIASIVGSAVSLVFSFVGYKLAVFKKSATS